MIKTFDFIGCTLETADGRTEQLRLWYAKRKAWEHLAKNRQGPVLNLAEREVEFGVIRLHEIGNPANCCLIRLALEFHSAPAAAPEATT